MWNAYYEFKLPTPAVDELKTKPSSLHIILGSLATPGEVILKQVTFFDVSGEKERNLLSELSDIAAENNNTHTAAEIKTSAKEYEQFDWISHPLYNVFYRDLIDTTDNSTKRYYFQIRQDVDAPMLFAEWWAFQKGYEPEIPWQSESAWRQCWKYLGSE